MCDIGRVGSSHIRSVRSRLSVRREKTSRSALVSSPVQSGSASLHDRLRFCRLHHPAYTLHVVILDKVALRGDVRME